MTALTLELTDYPLRKYERKLARLETAGVGLAVSGARKNLVLATTSKPYEQQLERLTFFKRISTPDGPVIPAQRLLDLSTGVLRSSRSREDLVAAMDHILAQKNGHRASVHTYLTHGLHEYKGKFYPQLVRSLVNYAGVSSGVLLDPFCGSGTTTLEAFLIGLRGVGVDLNPLAAFIARTKVSVLCESPDDVVSTIDRLERRLAIDARRSDVRFELPNEEYLRKWFDVVTLERLRVARWAIEEEAVGPTRDLCLVVLSDLIRSSSLQRPGQLRIYRRAEAPDTSGLFTSFISQARRVANAAFVYQYLRERHSLGNGPVNVYAADARQLAALPDPDLKPGQVDVVVTSPPYATALPYLDTDRLSLAFLGLLTPEERRKTDFEMIGNREIGDRQRRILEDRLIADRELPRSIHRFLMRVFEGNRKGSVGFRRRNAAALLYKYFVDMLAASRQIHEVLRSGRLMAIVIGNSRTVVGGTSDLEIPTDRFLLEIAELAGFERDQWIPMTDQPQYMIHTKNGIRSETIFTVRKVGS